MNTLQTSNPVDQLRAMATMALTAAAIALSPFAAAAGCAVAAVRPRWRRVTDLRVCLGGLVLVVVFVASGAVADTLGAGWHAFASVPGGPVLHFNWALERASSRLLVGWGLLLPLAPTLGYLVDVVRPKPVVRKAMERQTREERTNSGAATKPNGKAAKHRSPRKPAVRAGSCSGVRLAARQRSRSPAMDT